MTGHVQGRLCTKCDKSKVQHRQRLMIFKQMKNEKWQMTNDK